MKKAGFILTILIGTLSTLASNDMENCKKLNEAVTTFVVKKIQRPPSIDLLQ